MTAVYLTPKLPKEGCTLPVCPPPPTMLTHQPLLAETENFPILNLFIEDDFSSSSDNNEPGVGLSLDGSVVTDSKSTFKTLPSKRSSNKRPVPLIRLKPRPSKYTSPSNPNTRRGSAKSTCMNRHSRALQKSSSLHALSRSSSFQQLYRRANSVNKPSSLPRRPSFSRAA